MGKWVHTPGEWYAEGQEKLAQGMQASEDMKFHAISAPMDKAASTTDGPLVLQFTVKHEKKDYAFCGGGYIKLLPGKVDAKTFGGETPYAIMFGPDLCGYDVSRIHLIFEHQGENLLKEEDIKLEYDEKDKLTHLYTLVLDSEAGEYEVFFDQKSKSKGELSEGWAFPAKKIKDPDQSKPDDWVEQEEIEDPDAKKPEGWDEIPKDIPDPEAEKPEDWIEEDDGDWDPPMVPNPEYKGEWMAPMVPNPAYKGEWVHPEIDNPKYAPDTYAKFEALTHVGFELWTVNMGSIFDNVLVTDDMDYANKMADETWALLNKGEKDAQTAWDAKKNPPPADYSDDDADAASEVDAAGSEEEGDAVALEEDDAGAHEEL